MVCYSIPQLMTYTNLHIGAILRPGDLGFLPSRAEKDAYHQAFRRLLWPRVVNYELLDRHLQIANWDVQEAYDGFLCEEARVLIEIQALHLSSSVNTGPTYPYNSAGPARSLQDIISQRVSRNTQLTSAVS